MLAGASKGRGLGPLTGLLELLVVSRFVSQRLVTFLARIHHEDLVVLSELAEAGKLTPVIDRHYSLSEVPDALRYLGTGHARGKVVINVA